MAKAILEFDLSSEREEYDSAMKGGIYHTVILDIMQALRNELKYNSDKLEKRRVERVVLEEWRAKFWEILDGHDVSGDF